jgi:hypothetical protein
MSGAVPRLGRMRSSKPTRREAAVCLALVAVWTSVAVWQAVAVFPWNHGGVYVRASGVVSAASEAVIVAVLAIWLLGRSRLLRSS